MIDVCVTGFVANRNMRNVVAICAYNIPFDLFENSATHRILSWCFC